MKYWKAATAYEAGGAEAAGGWRRSFASCTSVRCGHRPDAAARLDRRRARRRAARAHDGAGRQRHGVPLRGAGSCAGCA
ncbi:MULTISPECIES: hypothetical protein [Paenibacillus]|uniref:hypothetical protein n=1 Tax=Paenibacillus TaxID=44249 RepID=UPI0020CA216F|nr:hypothetical protein [Paenibacillus odorifer]